MKGIIFPAGYRAFEFTEQETYDFGGKGIKLSPWNPRHRTWWFRVPDDYERKEWLFAFEYACSRSKPPQDPNKLLAKAFDLALNDLRQHYSFWGYYCGSGKEMDRLAHVILDILDINVLYTIFNNIPESSKKVTMINETHKFLMPEIESMCQDFWQTFKESIQTNEIKLMNDTKSLISPILEKEIEFKALINEKVHPFLDPFLEMKSNSMIFPILSKLAKPVIFAYLKSVVLFHNFIKEEYLGMKVKSQDYFIQLQEQLREEQSTAKRFSRSFLGRSTNFESDYPLSPNNITLEKSFSMKMAGNDLTVLTKNEEINHHPMEDPTSIQIASAIPLSPDDRSQLYTLSLLYQHIHSFNGPFKEAYEKIHSLYINDLNPILSLLTGGVTAYLLYTILINNLKKILFQALFTFYEFVKNIENDQQIPEVLLHVSGLLLYDIQITLKSTLSLILKTILTPLLKEFIIQPAENVLIEIKENYFHKFIVPELSLYLSLNNILLKNLDEQIDHYLLIIIEKSCKNDLTTILRKISREVGVSIDGDSIGIGTWRQFSADDTTDYFRASSFTSFNTPVDGFDLDSFRPSQGYSTPMAISALSPDRNPHPHANRHKAIPSPEKNKKTANKEEKHKSKKNTEASKKKKSSSSSSENIVSSAAVNENAPNQVAKEKEVAVLIEPATPVSTD